ncbi:MAG: hypothetical protein ACE5ER_04365, partial [Nitrospinaceae bacterium]
MTESPGSVPVPEDRMKSYLQKVAAGPRMSKDLTEAEAEDGLRLVLERQVSTARAAVFLIATRMKRETTAENLGFWRALTATGRSVDVRHLRLLQVADAFDGYRRIPYYGFFTIPLLARLGLPAYGHSALPLPPKFGITFEDLLQNHYGVNGSRTLEQRAAGIERCGFGYVDAGQSHPRLEALRGLRVEIVKRPMLATLEKMLMPLRAERNFLATNYFHPGYEEPMLAVARASAFDRVIIGNGMEGGTLYGLHKAARVFLMTGEPEAEERRFQLSNLYPPAIAERLETAFEALKTLPAAAAPVAQAGEAALKGAANPARDCMAHHAAVFL